MYPLHAFPHGTLEQLQVWARKGAHMPCASWLNQEEEGVMQSQWLWRRLQPLEMALQLLWLSQWRTYA